MGLFEQMGAALNPYPENKIETNNSNKPFLNEEAQLQIIESVNSCEGRIENGADITQAFDWLREEMEQIFSVISVNDTSLTK